MFHRLTRRQTISVLALVAVLVLGGVAWRFHQHQNAPACFVTGTGQQLCGTAATAYCDIHESEYHADNDTDSLNACEAARYGDDGDVYISPP